MANADWLFPRVVSGIVHGEWRNFDEYGCRCHLCVAAWRERGWEIEKTVAALDGDDRGGVDG